MIRRWRGRGTSLAIVLALGIVAAAGSSSEGPASGRWQLVVRDVRDEVVLRAPLPDGAFAIGYRNSIYRSLAREEFEVTAEGRLTLTRLAADEVAVLGEYYSADRPQPTGGAGLRWHAVPARPLTVHELPIAATEHGRRTLIVPGRDPVPLWELAHEGSPVIRIGAEPAR